MARPRICEDETAARQFLERLRWPEGPVCPECATPRPVALPPRLYHCSACRRQFSVTVGTILAASHIPLHKWLRAFHFLCQRREGVTVVALRAELELATYLSAWKMAQRIRWALTRPPLKTLLASPLGPRRPLRIELPFLQTARAFLQIKAELRNAPSGERAAGAKLVRRTTKRR